MAFREYQALAARTAGMTEISTEKRLAVAALGLAGEAGEVADHIKKAIGHGHELDRGELEDELGDVLWYIAEMCNTLDLSLARVAARNIEKLKRRYPVGFDAERSRNRVE